ncbi:NADH-quinone oxidoreductase subunit J [Legionella saoudiensis]|uniref:NADH-quinone oxidoreductase subunit J n=1 Tax=Legionella saoudiensis TaxID=1750561 RepID=UPI0007319450|nr:NADH-quinone oxidoreductase subunit J [Legionella saoudiensis]
MHDLLIQTIFYIFAALTVGSALLAVTQSNPVRCVLFLVFTFFTSSVLWILAEAEFLALILVLVYVGAVMTLFLFVVMMLNIDVESVKGQLKRYLPFGLIVIALFIALLMKAIPEGSLKSNVETKPPVASSASQSSSAESQQKPEPILVEASNTEALGMVLYTDYFLAFELAAVLLLVAIVSAITLVHRGARYSKRQDVKQQIMTRSSDRVELVTMKAEK